ncbi:hypothetical protein D769_04314 [Cupriavidus sp. HMR-1]|nr:hypothetical protein D769_04314 [Cupriavidus sp. HMR-1]
MGEARRRGSRAQREAEAIKRNKQALAVEMGLADEHDPIRLALIAGLDAFKNRMTASEWSQRRGQVLEHLKNRRKGSKLAEAESIRVREDEMGWYLFLCEQSIYDPLCVDVSQSQRILPYFASLGLRWHHAREIVGIERKLDELLHDYRKHPDGHFFELLVALSYAEAGWRVTFIEEVRGEKNADIHVVRGKEEYFVECKRMSRTTDYSVKERNRFLEIWHAGRDALVKNQQWIWFKGTFHKDLFELPDSFLLDLWKTSLPLGLGERVLVNNEAATIKARLIDRSSVIRHFREFKVKMNSPMFTRVIGGDWAPDNSSVTLLPLVQISHVQGCEARELGMYVEEVGFACGFTRETDSEVSIDKKAKDVKKLLSEAVRQVPNDRPSIIHLAAETMEGGDVERRRTEKLEDLMRSFSFEGKPVKLVRFHRLQSHQRTNMQFEIDETVDTLHGHEMNVSATPRQVVVPYGSSVQQIAHWDLPI